METTNFGFVASLLFVGVGLDQSADALINALHLCREIFILEKKATFKRWRSTIF